MSKCIGVLALQGAFREHVAALRALGVETREVRQLRDLSGTDAMVIPGGESTTMGKLLNELGIMQPLRERIDSGMPVFGTCAGLILLCREIVDSQQPRLGELDAVVRRNAFGRQVDSFEENLPVPVLGPEPFPAVFIRAPIIMNVGSGVEVLAHVTQDGDKRAVAVRQGNILAASFHPELTEDTRFHKYFLDMCQS